MMLKDLSIFNKSEEQQPEIWSVDFMVANDKIYLIDMTLGYRSAYWKTKYLSKKL